MAPGKRKPRRKEPNETSELELPDSSPAGPSAKKRRTNGTRVSQRQRRISPDPTLPDDESDSSPGEGENTSNKDLIDSVISYLQVASHPVAVVSEHANEKINEAQKVTAYAKIAGRDWTYFVLGQVVNIGRPPDKDPDAPPILPSSPLADMKESLPVHIDLGPSKYVSRHHACVFYDAEYPENGGWHLKVDGRNGVRVNHNLLKRGESHLLTSGDIMEIASTQMMWVTPGDKAIIEPSFVERAKMAASGGEDWAASQHAHPPAQSTHLPAGSLYPMTANHQPLAPAPPYFKRAVTPPPTQKDGRGQRGVFDSKPPQSPMYNRGMMMESTQDIDYSQDAAKDLKPPFSYATMIAQAIFSNEEEKLTLSNIYAWISDKYAFYRHSNSGWQNSIRHNLSLNKAFQKVPRRTDEPGKGMKWQIAPEFRQEYLKKQAKKGFPSSSSAPTSPAAPGLSKDIAPEFQGANGQNLGYDSSYVSQFPAVNTNHQVHAMTPERRPRTNTQTTAPNPDLDTIDSPLPLRHNTVVSPSKQPHYSLPPTISMSHPQHSQHSPSRTASNNEAPPASNPTLSSSYLDTPFHSNHTNVITPAPRKLQNIRLAPPSTLVAPSKFMPPDSSPAGPHGIFWRGLMSSGGPGFLGSTPAGPAVLDMSPVKHHQSGDGGDVDVDDKDMMSSSPPPMDGPGASPSKRISSSAIRLGSGAGVVKREPEASMNTNMNSGGVNGLGIASTSHGGHHISRGDNEYLDNDGEADEGDAGGAGIGGGFDLAKGFQPIGSFNSSSSFSQPRQQLQQQQQGQPQGFAQQRHESHVGAGSTAAAAARAGS